MPHCAGLGTVVVQMVSTTILRTSNWSLKMAAQENNAPSGQQYSDGAHFQQLEYYPWDSDNEFQSGLQAILGSNPTPEQAQQLELRARCFYFSRYAISHIIRKVSHWTKSFGYQQEQYPNRFRCIPSLALPETKLNPSQSHTLQCSGFWSDTSERRYHNPFSINNT